MTVSRRDFPADFAWGTATASYQNEGATEVDGRGTSIWDVFARTHGAINDGSTGDVADDHYHRFREDVRIMSDLGLNSYRFSIAWPRIQPTGSGPANQAGLDFYRRLVDELQAQGIAAYATLYHWDLPQSLEDEGGWLDRDTANRFADYAGIVSEALGTGVAQWITLNEPWCSAFLGYAAGAHAPGRRVGKLAGRAAHHLMLGHGLAVPAIRAADGSASVGITLNLTPSVARTERPEDVEAARRIDGLANRLFLDPVLTGAYPDDVVEDLELGEWLAPTKEADLAVIAAPIDFVGINYYFRNTVGAGDHDTEPRLDHPTSTPVRFYSTTDRRTHMGWPITPDGIIEVLSMVHDRRPELPIAITENGAAYDDRVEDGAIHDEDRRAFLESHIDACARAIEQGLPLVGYFIWTLTDNWEWAWGFSRRFGLVRVDYGSLERTVKDSGRWLAEFLSAGDDA